jgi:hypothetical protein
LMSANDVLPRVARRALPWAERLHPFRITHGRICILLVQLQPRGKDVGNDKRLQPTNYGWIVAASRQRRLKTSSRALSAGSIARHDVETGECGCDVSCGYFSIGL